MPRLAEALTKAGCRGLSASNLKNFRQVALAYPGLDAADPGRQLSLHASPFPTSVTGQMPGQPDATSQIRQTSGELHDWQFPSLARRTPQAQPPWRDASWVRRLFTTLRQYRVTAANRHYYIDLLMFHRRLRCLVAVDLKLGAFEPEHTGQLRFYVNYLAEHAAYPDENPPVGILLCTERNAEVVRFATAGDGDIFVSRYQFELPTEDQLRQWLREERDRLEIE